MSLVEERFRPELLKTFVKIVQPVKQRHELKGSAQQYTCRRKDVANSASSLQFEVQPTNLQTVMRRDIRLAVPKFTYHVRINTSWCFTWCFTNMRNKKNKTDSNSQLSLS